MIKCPKCDSENIQITSGTDNRKQPKWKVKLITGLLIATIVSVGLLFTTKNGIFAITGMISFLPLAVITKWINDAQKDKKDVIHTKAVCQNCGHIEYLD